MAFFLSSWVITLIGWAIHVFADKHADRRTRTRVIELLLVWLLVVIGVFGVVGGLGHIGPTSGQLAEGIGYAQSMFQWEVGWGDLALSVLLIGCAWPKLRGQWMTATIVVLTIQYGGDAIGHVMEYVAHNNTAPDNVWAIPSDFLQPIIAITLFLLYRAGQRQVAAAKTDDATA